MKFSDVWRATWDTETTGPEPLDDRIVTAAFTVRAPGVEDRTFEYLINPGIPIPEATTKIHGVSTAKAQAEGRDPRTALDEIANHLLAALARGMPVVAFNQSFDWSILHYDLIRNGLPTMEDRLGTDPVTLVDPHVIDQHVMPRVRGKNMRRLKPTAERYGVKVENWHEASADAAAALGIAEAQFERHARLAEVWDRGPAALFAAQQQWRAAQQAGRAAWFSGRGEHDKARTVRGEWPLIPAAADGPGAGAVSV